MYIFIRGYAVAQLVEALLYKPEGRGFDSSIDPIPPASSFWSHHGLSRRVMGLLYIPSIHPWHYSPFRALASLKSCLHSSLFSVLLLHPRVPNNCKASFCTASSHLILGLPTGLVLWNFPFRTFFGVLPSSILII